MNREKLIISLIRDDLLNSKLVSTLDELGLQAGPYFLNLGDTIFKLMGFSDGPAAEQVYRHYLQLSKKARHIAPGQAHAGLQKLAREIYLELKLLQAKSC